MHETVETNKQGKKISRYDVSKSAQDQGSTVHALDQMPEYDSACDRAFGIFANACIVTMSDIAAYCSMSGLALDSWEVELITGLMSLRQNPQPWEPKDADN